MHIKKEKFKYTIPRSTKTKSVKKKKKNLILRRFASLSRTVVPERHKLKVFIVPTPEKKGSYYYITELFKLQPN